MKKILCVFCASIFLVIIITGCSLENVKNMINVNVERIGIEYTVIEGQSLEQNGTHGYVENYSSDYNNNIWTTKFDLMDSTEDLFINIEPSDSLKITTNIDSGEVVLKITQGYIVNSEIQKIQAKNGETVTADLSQWNSGEISLWLVVNNGENGEITIEHVKNPIE